MPAARHSRVTPIAYVPARTASETTTPGSNDQVRHVASWTAWATSRLLAGIDHPARDSHCDDEHCEQRACGEPKHAHESATIDRPAAVERGVRRRFAHRPPRGKRTGGNHQKRAEGN